MQEFKRKPNNLRSYLLFRKIALPFMVLLALFPISIFFFETIDSTFDIILLPTVSIGLFALTIFSYRYSLKHIQAKTAYMNMMDIPILTLTNTHFIYKPDDLEQYYLPWDHIVDIRIDPVIEKYKDKLGYISITYDEEMYEYVQDVIRNSYITDRAGDVILSIMYFEETLETVYQAIMDVYQRNKKKDN